MRHERRHIIRLVPLSLVLQLVYHLDPGSAIGFTDPGICLFGMLPNVNAPGHEVGYPYYLESYVQLGGPERRPLFSASTLIFQRFRRRHQLLIIIAPLFQSPACSQQERIVSTFKVLITYTLLLCHGGIGL